MEPRPIHLQVYSLRLSVFAVILSEAKDPRILYQRNASFRYRHARRCTECSPPPPAPTTTLCYNPAIVTPPETPKKALICGVTGQDGAYLAQFLLAKGYQVYGSTRDLHGPHTNLHRLGIFAHVHLLQVHLPDLASVLSAFERATPDEIYNLAGQTSVTLSFQLPVETYQSLALSSLNLLEAIRLRGAGRLFEASSAACFGPSGRTPITVETPMHPHHPYGMAKAAARLQVGCYRESFGVYACAGIMFNHESPLRPEAFVTQKVISAVGAIARGSQQKLHLGALDVYRDWGWAPEYVEAMWLMLQQPAPQDFIIATGHTRSLRDFVDTAFRTAGLDPRDHLVQDHALLRATDTAFSCGDPNPIAEKLGWRARSHMPQVVQLMLQADAEAHS